MEEVYQRVNSSLVQTALGGISPEEAKKLENKVDQAITKANVALPKTGGAMSGPIESTAEGYPLIRKVSLAKDAAGNYQNKEEHIAAVLDGSNLVARLGIHVKDKVKKATLFAHGKKADGTDIWPYLAACLDEETGYAWTEGTCMPVAYEPRLVNGISLINYAMAKLIASITVHVGGANASDTANLFEGRGLSADMPFASLLAAIQFAAHYSGNGMVNIQIHADLIWNYNSPLYLQNASYVQIGSASGEAIHKITMQSPFYVAGGCLVPSNLNLEAVSPARNFFLVDGQFQNAVIRLGDGITLSGTVASTVATATNGGRLIAAKVLNGAPAGSRYMAYNYGIILTGNRGQDAIPGTIDGTCDSSSVYA